DHHPALVEALSDPDRPDVADLRLAVTGVGEDAGLRPGDVIRAFNREDIASLAELNELLSAQPRLMALTVEREGQTLLLIMP
ncbi:MAG: PDZ domain-containing protein, partial [Gammaproteobacteria bacterium]|nr:PDZ domain-containing protein [Gammaproteobacteria bacterium]